MDKDGVLHRTQAVVLFCFTRVLWNANRLYKNQNIPCHRRFFALCSRSVLWGSEVPLSEPLVLATWDETLYEKLCYLW